MSYLPLPPYRTVHTFAFNPMSLIMLSLLLVFLTACSGPLVGVTVVDERTALENQVLGTYQELNQQVMLVASVRYIDPKGKLKQTQELPPGKKDVVRALQRVSFNKDDLNRYKSLGIIGENNEGGVTLLEPEKVQPDDRAFVENLIKEENEDRLEIMRRIIETNETLTPSELPRVHKMFAALNRDKALKGERIQLDNGTWTQKDPTP
ncbi:DUF1318 domain-containing protein [uncultured Nitrospira sp.]|uniref:DUF1318 domain-containing protein n=1 Tax=uncultured Nitrospira sp. TaxID=157176 RepID=UPI00313FF94A